MADEEERGHGAIELFAEDCARFFESRVDIFDWGFVPVQPSCTACQSGFKRDLVVSNVRSAGRVAQACGGVLNLERVIVAQSGADGCSIGSV